jgi:hypothetical protein
MYFFYIFHGFRGKFVFFLEKFFTCLLFHSMCSFEKGTFLSHYAAVTVVIVVVRSPRLSETWNN